MKISHPVTCDRLLRPKMSPLDLEVWCIALTLDFELIHYQALFRGFQPRFPQMLKKVSHFGLSLSSEKLILMSTHPIDPIVPSEKDLFWTEKLQESLALLEVQLLDHILISPKTHFSFLHWEPQIFDRYGI